MDKKENFIGRFGFDSVWLLICLAVLVRLVFLGYLDLLPEEAYYWNYADHLSIGYLDHPPMVAWLIYLSELLLGRNEFAVRLPAFLGWLAFAWFMFRFSARMLGKAVGKWVVLLLAVFPIYMSVGFLMTPDAPFYLFWAATLFLLERAIFGPRPAVWYLAGISLGLGLLSKYTMGLVVPAVLAFLLLDRESRRWLLRPQPYIALILAMIVFLPVLIWNYHNDWASFAFQGSRRWSGELNFQLHILIGSIFVLITPMALYHILQIVRSYWVSRRAIRQERAEQSRRILFMLLLTAVPLTVFVIHSLRGQPKLNWTGPVWLAVLPLLADRISTLNLSGLAASTAKLRGRWIGYSTVLVLLFLVGFSYLVAGMPGAPKQNGMRLPIAWSAFGDRIERLEHELEHQSGSEPLIIGLDKYWLVSEASFYDSMDDDSLPEFAGENLVGGNGLMWKEWSPPGIAAGRTAMLISFTEGRLNEKGVVSRFSELGEIKKETLTNEFGEIGHFYWRTARVYQAM